MRADERLQKVLRLLQGAIRAAGFTQTEIDEKIGRRRGYLSHVFQRRVDLKLADLLRVLDVLQVSPAAFFSFAGSASRQAPAEPEVAEGPPALNHMMKLVAEAVEADVASAARADLAELPSDDMLFQRVRAIVHEVLAVSAPH